MNLTDLVLNLDMENYTHGEVFDQLRDNGLMPKDLAIVEVTFLDEVDQLRIVWESQNQQFIISEKLCD
jgi:hypothetical protein